MAFPVLFVSETSPQKISYRSVREHSVGGSTQRAHAVDLSSSVALLNAFVILRRERSMRITPACLGLFSDPMVFVDLVTGEHVFLTR
jgi:hypothetical protein